MTTNMHSGVAKKLMISVTITEDIESDKFQEAVYQARYLIANETGIYPTELIISEEDERRMRRATWLYDLYTVVNAMMMIGGRPHELFGLDFLVTSRKIQPEIRAYVEY